MKKISALLALITMASSVSAQYMIVGADSIALADFKKEYAYGLEHNGIANTLKTTQDFLLLQQFAQAKKADTIASFRENMWQRESELRKEFFYPKEVIEPVLQDFINSSRTEKKIQIFMVEKTPGEKQDFQKIYSEVKSGKMTMDDAIAKFTKGSANALYVKPGSIDNALYADLKNLANGSYTKLINNERFVAFAKVLDSRLSLGYVVFGTISYPNDSQSEQTKTTIYNELKAGKTFQQVAKLYGSSDHEKNNGGVVLGSPTLPDEVYAALKGQKKDFYSQPVLMGERYYIFNIYQLFPYQLEDTNREFFFNEMQNTLYSDLVEEKLIAYIKSQPGFKEFPVARKLSASYPVFSAYAKADEVLYQYNNIKTTVADVKKVVSEHAAEAAKLSPQQWQEAFGNMEDQNLIAAFNADFVNRPAVRKQLNETRKSLYSDYIFTKYLKQEVEAHPEWVTDYYNKNKSQFIWEKRAKGRVAIIADPALVPQIKKEIKDPKNWDDLKKKYYGKLNAENQVLVHFEEGEMSEGADVFTKYKVPYSKGVHAVKMEKRDLVLAIEDLLPPTQMTQEEATEMVKEALTDQRLAEVVAQQRAITKIVVQPEFLQDLEKNFKK